MTDPFASFVGDPATLAAVAAARLAAEANRMPYNPLVLVGPRGSGKSHLLRSIADRVALADPPRSVELVALGRLAEHVPQRGLSESGAALRDRLQRADVVLADDLDAVARHLSVQAFLFDILDRRVSHGRTTVIASAMLPGRIAELDSRLLRCFREATVVEVGLPGTSARRTILERRVRESGVSVADSLVVALAEAELASVKEYLGALNRILAFQQASPTLLAADDALALVGLERRVDALSIGGDASATARTPEPPSSEFDSFLSEVVANVSHQFDRWRGRIREAIGHWQGQGLRTRRLETALAGEGGGDPEPVIAEFGHDAGELQRLAAEVRVLAPDLAGAEVFRDPDQLVAARQLVAEARARRAPLSAPLAELTLETLGVGASNRMALEAAAAVVADPGTRYNPLVIVGPSGVGKTHLLHGIGNALSGRGLSPVACLSAHSLLGELAGHAGAEPLAQWRARYQWVAALLIDDIHLLANEPRAQTELLQLYGALADANRPMIFTTARRLSDLEGFDPRLLTRLEAGLVVDLGSPDRDVRMVVVKALLAATPVATDAALLDFFAGRPVDSVRALQGAVQRVLGEAAAQGVLPSPALGREALDIVESGPSRPAKRVGSASGILSPGFGIVRSREKTIHAWPSPGDRLVVEL
ncbi:MAG: DnaA ATPase domain-containing protein [Gemmatimonadales bacterium]